MFRYRTEPLYPRWSSTPFTPLCAPRLLTETHLSCKTRIEAGLFLDATLTSLRIANRGRAAACLAGFVPAAYRNGLSANQATAAAVTPGRDFTSQVVAETAVSVEVATQVRALLALTPRAFRIVPGTPTVGVEIVGETVLVVIEAVPALEHLAATSLDLAGAGLGGRVGRNKCPVSVGGVRSAQRGNFNRAVAPRRTGARCNAQPRR